MYDLPKKAIIKANRELLELHKRCIITYLTQRALKHKYQKKFLIIYDKHIDPKNIRNFFHRPISLFVKALVQDRLGEISYYTKSRRVKNKKVRRKRDE